MSTSIFDRFAAAMEAAGVVPPDTIHADGQLHRFSPTGRRSDNAGWYCLHGDNFPAGVFGCWRTGLVQTWTDKHANALSQAERETMRQRIKDAKAQRDADLRMRQQRAAATASAMWNAGKPASSTHSYLLSKGVKPYGLRADLGWLMVPAYGADGQLTSLQTIAQDGVKRFLPGGRLQGSFCPIGDFTQASAIAICEGWATGSSIHEATGLPVAVAFFAGNLLPVVQALHRKCPGAALVLAADDDYRVEGNPGLTAARAAALSVGAQVVAPQFPAERPRKATDFNDLHSLAGAGAVRACFAEVLEGLNHEDQ
ncbi:toprim domain-containing protein [Comamonas sp. J-3]|uniref:toprim domain-containing protein n=1 Tax=Comamonas trifloxystrobinivorans TaxID=3350256 RepID=UPI00372639C5